MRPRVFWAPEGSAAREARASLRSAPRLEARPCPPDPPAPSTPVGSGVLMMLGASPRSPARPRHRQSISHVIPLRLVQILNLHRSNCNVFGVSRKMTTINYVRNLGCGGVVAARGHRSFSGPPMWSGLSCWDFGAFRCVLLQTSSIRGVFRVDSWVVVTNVVNSTAFSLKTLIFLLRLTTFVTGVLARRFELRWFDDVCNVGRPLVARPGGPPPPTGIAAWPCRPAGPLV